MISPYLQYKTYMRDRYGEPLFRVPIDFDLGCPNRNTDGSGGCTFCNARGARAVQTLNQETIEEQMAEAIRFAICSPPSTLPPSASAPAPTVSRRRPMNFSQN